MVPDAITTVFVPSAGKVKKVANIRTIGDSLNQTTMVESMLDAGWQVFLSVSYFSSTKHNCWEIVLIPTVAKNLRSSVTQQHLDNLFLMYVQTAKTEQLDLASVAYEFVSSRTRRMNYFGKF